MKKAGNYYLPGVSLQLSSGYVKLKVEEILQANNIVMLRLAMKY